LEVAEIARRFARKNLILTEDALNLLLSSRNVEAAVEKVLDDLRSMQERVVMVDAETLKRFIQMEEESKPPEVPQSRVGELVHEKFRPISAEHEPRVKILKDVTGRSLGRGTVEDFHRIFKSRFEKLSRILRGRPGMEHAVLISSLQSFEGERVTVIGMVLEKRRFKGDTLAIELEDQTGTVTVLVTKANRKLLEKAERIVPDEVIAVQGRVSSSYGGRPRIFADQIEWPGAPVSREVRRAEVPAAAVLISDLHVGSDKFLEDVFARFVRWLRDGGETEREKELAGMVKYVVIAGDLVDGIGVYPEQYDELLIPDIFRQYETAAKLLADLPDHITVVISPGNHDAVRMAEPQPAIPKDMCPDLYDRGAVMVGNPALVSIEGVHLLIYHGRSFDDMVGVIPGAKREQPVELMKLMLEKRHLAPMYGGKVLFSPEKEDLFVIEEIPDIIHTGHTHIHGCERYKDVLLVNSGTFQERTEYMKKLGVTPTPGKVSVVNLMTHEFTVLEFM